MKHEGNLGSDKNILYPDWGVGYTDTQHSFQTHLCISLYIKSSSIKNVHINWGQCKNLSAVFDCPIVCLLHAEGGFGLLCSGPTGRVFTTLITYTITSESQDKNPEYLFFYFNRQGRSFPRVQNSWCWGISITTHCEIFCSR